MSQWVQHVSGQGEKWEVIDLSPHQAAELAGIAYPVKGRWSTFYLPQSEYSLCAPPDEWEDVTGWFTENDLIFAPHIGKGYRRRKVEVLIEHDLLRDNKWAFIVERRKS